MTMIKIHCTILSLKLFTFDVPGLCPVTFTAIAIVSQHKKNKNGCNGKY